MSDRQSDTSSRSEALRAELEREIGPIRDDHWQFALLEELDAAVLDGGGSESRGDLLNVIARQREAANRAADQTPRSRRRLNFESGDGPSSLRETAISQMVGEMARSDPWVVSFREQHLEHGDGEVRLLEPPEVVPWIWARVVVRITRPLREPLRYLAPEQRPSRASSWQLHEVPTANQPVLEELRALAQVLHGQNRWSEEATVLWILTGIAPQLREVRWRTERSSPQVLDRVVMEIDPTMQPREVASAYGRARKDLVPGRHRDLSDKHLRLAAAAMSRAGIWRDEMAIWNSHFPQWRYKEWKIFARDAKRALERLSGTRR